MERYYSQVIHRLIHINRQINDVISCTYFQWKKTSNKSGASPLPKWFLGSEAHGGAGLFLKRRSAERAPPDPLPRAEGLTLNNVACRERYFATGKPNRFAVRAPRGARTASPRATARARSDKRHSLLNSEESREAGAPERMNKRGRQVFKLSGQHTRARACPRATQNGAPQARGNGADRREARRRGYRRATGGGGARKREGGRARPRKGSDPHEGRGQTGWSEATAEPDRAYPRVRLLSSATT